MTSHNMYISPSKRARQSAAEDAAANASISLANTLCIMQLQKRSPSGKERVQQTQPPEFDCLASAVCGKSLLVHHERIKVRVFTAPVGHIGRQGKKLLVRVFVLN